MIKVKNDMKEIQLNEFPYLEVSLVLIITIFAYCTNIIFSIFSPILSNLFVLIVTLIFIQTIVAICNRCKPPYVTNLCVDEIDNEQYLILSANLHRHTFPGNGYCYEDYIKENKHYKFTEIHECYIVEKTIPFLNRLILKPISNMLEIHIKTDMSDDVIPVYFNSSPAMKIKEINRFLQVLPNYIYRVNE